MSHRHSDPGYEDGARHSHDRELHPTPWPTELRLHKDRKTLTVAFDNGESFDLAAEYLRVRSPSAEVQGHSPAERKTVAGKKNVAILEVKPVGNYAVRLVFDDMHSTGIYSWDYLRELGRDRDGQLAGRISTSCREGTGAVIVGWLSRKRVHSPSKTGVNALPDALWQNPPLVSSGRRRQEKDDGFRFAHPILRASYWLLLHDHRRADLYALVEVDDIVVGQPEAA